MCIACEQLIVIQQKISFFIEHVCLFSRYHDGGRLSDQQMALLQYQRENLHYLSEEV